MLTLNDGRKELYQWDTGRTATVDIECDVVHFANLKYGESLAVEVKVGEVDIPNKLLMSGEPIYCWAFVKDEGGAYTKKEQTFAVIKRAKPSDYVYTETDVITVKTAVEKALEEAKESGDFKGEKGDKGDKGDKGEQGIQGMQGEKGKDGKDGTNGEDGYSPIKGKDYYTEKDKQEIIKDVLGEIDGSDVFVEIANITVEEAVNTITINETTFHDITKVKDFYIAFLIAKPETAQSGTLLIKASQTYSQPTFGVVNAWNHANYILKGNFYSKCFDDNFRFNFCAETFGANNLVSIKLATTISQTLEPVKAITIQCSTASSTIPVGSNIRIRGHVCK